MKVKKLLPLCLLGIMGLVACGGGNDAPSEFFDVEGDKKVTVWATADEELVIKRVITKWNQAQADSTTKFGLTYAPVAEGVMKDEVMKDATAESAPDLFLCADDHIYDLQKNGHILEIKDKAKEKVKANNTDVAYTASSYKDKLFGFPVTSDNGYFLWYNKSVLTDNDVATLEGLVAKAKSLQKTVGYSVDDTWYLSSFFMGDKACGGDSMQFKEDANGKAIYETNWDNEKGAKIAEYISGLYTNNKTTLITASNDKILAGFKDGSMVAGVSGTWMENDLIKAIGAENLGATKLPSYKLNGEGEEIQLTSFVGSKLYAINKFKKAENQANALALADLLTNKDSQLIRFATRKSIPCNKEALLADEYKNNVSLGSTGLAAQSAFGIAQAAHVEGRYFDGAKIIGETMLSGTLPKNNTWAQFLKSTLDVLRVAAI